MANKLLLLLVATAAALGIGELLVRALCDVPKVKSIWVSSSDSVYRRSSNSLLSYELKPDYRNDDPDLVKEYESTNSHGLRDRDRRLEKPSGTQRVILLGDSVVEGSGIRETETISRQLENLLATENVEVLNFGVSGYCTRAEVELLEVKGIAFDPDIVVLVFTKNDFVNFNVEALILQQERDRPTVVKHLFVWSHLFRLTTVELNLFSFGIDADPARWNRQAIGENNVVSGLRRLRKLSQQHGFRTLVAVWPTFTDSGIVDVQFMPGGSRDLVIERLSWMNGIPTVRLSEDFKKELSAKREGANPRILYTVGGDEMHASPLGSSVAAQALKNHLARLKEGGFTVAQADNAPGEARGNTQAIAAAASLGQIEPNKSRVYNNLGLQSLDAGDTERAIEYFELSLKEDSENAEAHYNLGRMLQRLGRHQEAIGHYQSALQIQPGLAEVHNNWGNTLQALGRPGEAVGHYQEALGIKPDYAEAHYNWGNALKGLGRHQEAIGHYQESLRIKPDLAEAHYHWGHSLNALGRLQEAVGQFRQAVRIKPEYVSAHNSLGVILARQGQLAGAVRHFEHAVRLKPDDSGARQNLGAVRELLQQQNVPAPP